ncbi:MAG: rod shape-determining protein RodA [Candidatus Marinimicrobia bacterium]|nr:rod shape-determining protein RodA [Candidatus Neomarinimicrobiota bacterium]
MILAVTKRFREISSSVLVLPIILTFLGLLTLKSIAQHQDGMTSFEKQFTYLIPAILGLFTVLFIPKNAIHKYSYIAYGAILIGITIPYFGESTAGTYRWIDLGVLSIQPSEYAKWITILVLARYLSDHKLEVRNFTVVIIPIILVLIPTAIILKQPDLGTAAVLLTPVFPMLYWVGARPYHLFLLIAPILSIVTAFHMASFVIWVIIVATVLYLNSSTISRGITTFFTNIFLGLFAPLIWNSLHAYQQKRILTLFNPELDPLGAAYQIIQSQTAIGSGGLLGKGWGLGTQTHLKFLPVQESDFILSVIGEELGFIAVLFILILFAAFISRIVFKAFECTDRFSGLALVGIASVFLAHVFVNTAMTIGLIPVKGLPLPFVSYGGSFLLSCYMMLGIVLNLSIKSPT